MSLLITCHGLKVQFFGKYGRNWKKSRKIKMMGGNFQNFRFETSQCFEFSLRFFTKFYKGIEFLLRHRINLIFLTIYVQYKTANLRQVLQKAKIRQHRFFWQLVQMSMSIIIGNYGQRLKKIRANVLLYLWRPWISGFYYDFRKKVLMKLNLNFYRGNECA